MACVIGQPGVGNLKQLGKRALLPSATILGYAMVSSIGAAMWKGWTGFLTAVVGLTMGLILWRRDYIELARAIRSEWHSWSKGAKGEYDTARVLSELPDDYVVFHDYHPRRGGNRLASWNVDHVVVGPTGIFLLDSKNYSSSRIEPAEKDSHNRRNVRQAQRNAMEFKQALLRWSRGDLDGQFVAPVVVYTQPNAFVVKTRENWVRVIPLRWLKTEITAKPAGSLDAERVHKIALALFAQMSPALREAFHQDLVRHGEISKHARDLRMNRRVPSTPELRVDPRPAEETRHQAPSPEPELIASAHSSSPEPPTVCPLCGGALKHRLVRRGSKAGSEILGCENFAPRDCRFVYELSPNAPSRR